MHSGVGVCHDDRVSRRGRFSRRAGVRLSADCHAPGGYGRSGLLQYIDDAWAVFMLPVMDPAAPWLRTEHGGGEAAVRAVYRRTLLGPSDPRDEHLLAL